MMKWSSQMLEKLENRVYCHVGLKCGDESLSSYCNVIVD